jgi:hypothetical protein
MRLAHLNSAPSFPDGMRPTYHDRRPMTYYAVFGKVRFWRHSFTVPGRESLCPLDAELSLPAHCYADLLWEWAVYGATNESYRESQPVLERILGVSLSLQAIETRVADAAEDVAAFYTQSVEPSPRPTDGAILVVQADGKGVPMVPQAPVTPPVRLGKGQKPTKKKEAVVISLSTIAPYLRTPQYCSAQVLPGGGERKGNRSRCAITAAALAQPLRSKQSMSYVRLVGGRPTHRLISKLAMIATDTCIRTPLADWLSRWRQPNPHVNQRNNRSPAQRHREAKATHAASRSRGWVTSTSRSGLPSVWVLPEATSTTRQGGGRRRVW